MTTSEFEIVIDKIKDYTDNIYLHVKGEPLLHSHLDEILSICDSNKINVLITTNGTLLEKNKDILLNHSIKQINVSLHSENNLPDYYESVFNTCDELSKKMTIIYRIWTLKSLKLDKLSTKIVDKINLHYELSSPILEKIQNQKNIKIKENMYLDKDYEFDWPKISDKKSNIGTCLGTKSHIAILSNGNITPCCLDSSSIIKLGNIFKDNLQDVLNSELFKNINNGFKNNIAVHELCQSCTFKNRFYKN
jgi:radical SAM protein with 4Fe4S-binding SPASM domain